MSRRVFKPNTHFSHAYEDWTGEKWHWEVDGKHNSPLDSGDPVIIAFYIGFSYAKKGQEPLKNLKRSLNSLHGEFKRLDNEFNRLKYGK